MPLSKKRDKARKRIERAQAQSEMKDTRTRHKKRGLIYFILDRESNAVKIGIAEDPITKLRDMQVGNPHQLTIMKTIGEGTLLVERRLHRQFAEDRLSGEWFKYGRALKTYLNNGNSNLDSDNSNLNPVQPTGSISGLIMEGNRIAGVKPKQVAQAEPVQSNIPVYNPYEHYEPGNKVLIRRGKRMIETVIPEIDAEGYAIPNY